MNKKKVQPVDGLADRQRNVLIQADHLDILPCLAGLSSISQLRLNLKPLLHPPHPRPRHILILRRRPRTTPYRPHNHAILHNRHAARNRHEPAAVAVVDAKCSAAGPDSVFVHRRRGAVARGREGFVDGDGDGGEFCAGEAREGEEVEG